MREKNVASRSRRNSKTCGSKAMYDLAAVSDIKVCNQYGRYSTEVQVQSLFQDQTVSGIELWIVLTNLSERSHADPRGRESFGETWCKSETNTETVINKCWDFTLLAQRKWIDIDTQESKDPYCFQVSKFITRLLRQSQNAYREDDGAVHYDQVIDECKKKLSDNTGYWSD